MQSYSIQIKYPYSNLNTKPCKIAILSNADLFPDYSPRCMTDLATGKVDSWLQTEMISQRQVGRGEALQDKL